MTRAAGDSIVQGPPCSLNWLPIFPLGLTPSSVQQKPEAPWHPPWTPHLWTSYICSSTPIQCSQALTSYPLGPRPCYLQSLSELSCYLFWGKLSCPRRHHFPYCPLLSSQWPQGGQYPPCFPRALSNHFCPSFFQTPRSFEVCTSDITSSLACWLHCSSK